MYQRLLVPVDFQPPARIDGEGFHLRMLSVHDVVKDYATVMESEARLIGFMNPNEDWPRGLTILENLIDLGWHQREFTLRHSFAYTVMNDDESRCLGCCYIYPSDRPGYDAMAYYWAREAEYRSGFDKALGDAFRGLVAKFPFGKVAFPGRDIPWSQW
ncbi:MAG: hypothetical protein SGJ07_00850 [Rhodospirillaceae bacterium]|nr:hypothetical protein [Rhodospirillaceae bacterium]